MEMKLNLTLKMFRGYNNEKFTDRARAGKMG